MLEKISLKTNRDLIVAICGYIHWLLNFYRKILDIILVGRYYFINYFKVTVKVRIPRRKDLIRYKPPPDLSS